MSNGGIGPALEMHDQLQHGGRRRGDVTKTVMIVGMPGAGKSNLGNKILAHPTWDAFEEGNGTHGVTIEPQRAAWNDLAIIDTPGIPNADPQKTLGYFDAVVEALRMEGGLTALIFLVHQDNVSPSTFRDYAVLIRQFNHLPCSKLIVCRQRALNRRSKRAEEERRHAGAQFAEQVLESSGLSMPMVLLTEGYGTESYNQIDEITGFVRRSERMPVSTPSLRTSNELRHFVSRLADPTSRLEALKQEVGELEVSLWNRSLWMAAQIVPLAYLSVASTGAGCLWTGPYVKREQEALAELRREITDKKEEIEYTCVDEEELRAARSLLSHLDYISLF